MARAADSTIAGLLAMLCADPALRLVAGNRGSYEVSPPARSRTPSPSPEAVRKLLARGLLEEREPGRFAAASAASAWLKRRNDAEQPFRAQHGELAAGPVPGDAQRTALFDLNESPVATLARRSRSGGEPWLSADLLAAAERLRRDFEIGRLQPRVTANWSGSVNDGRRTGDGSGLADLTDMALAARLRFERAMRAVGPELSGVLVDICCFLKGLETVERERQWPARSAKLVLRMALASLARHYGLGATATGKADGKVRHWGAGDYRPAIT